VRRSFPLFRREKDLACFSDSDLFIVVASDGYFAIHENLKFKIFNSESYWWKNIVAPPLTTPPPPAESVQQANYVSPLVVDTVIR
jgi:hypothetical protein